MTQRWILSLTLGSCLALTSTVNAQRPGGGGPGGFPGGGMWSSPIMLLGSKEVQEELKLDDKQKEQLEALRTEMRPQRGSRGGPQADPAADAAAAATKGQAGDTAATKAQPTGGRRTAQTGVDPNAAQGGGDQNGQGGGGGQGGQGGGPPDFAGMMQRMQQAMQEAETKLAKILKPAQRTRLTQIALRMEGPFAIANKPEVATKLRVTEEQQEQIAAVMQDYQGGQQEMSQARRDFFTQMRDNGGMQRGTPLPKEAQSKMDSMQKETEAFKGRAEMAIGKVLTKKQRAAWESMLGAPFDTTKITNTGRGGRGGPAAPGADAANADTAAAAKAKTAAAAAAAAAKVEADAATPAKKSLRDRRGGTAAAPKSDTP